MAYLVMQIGPDFLDFNQNSIGIWPTHHSTRTWISLEDSACIFTIFAICFIPSFPLMVLSISCTRSLIVFSIYQSRVTLESSHSLSNRILAYGTAQKMKLKAFYSAFTQTIRSREWRQSRNEVLWSARGSALAMLRL